MVRFCKPVLVVLAGLSLVVGGCGSAATASPSKASAASSATPTASAAAATPTPAAPDTLFDLAIAEGPAWKSFHLKIAVDGTLKAAFLKSSQDPAFAKLKSDVALDGTVFEGDLDPVNLAAHLAITAPSIPGVSSSPITGDMIVKDSVMYLQLSPVGTKYHKTKLGTISRELGFPVAIPTPGGSSLVGIADTVASLRKQLETNGATPDLAGTEQIGGKDAYRINLYVPLDKLNSDIAAALAKSDADPSLKINIESASASMWIYKDTYQLAQVQLAGTSSTAGTISFTMTLTNFDQPVTINAPAASDIAPGN